MKMKLSDLLEQLHNLQSALGEDTDPEIRLATQPHYPHQYGLSHVRLIHTNEEYLEDLRVGMKLEDNPETLREMQAEFDKLTAINDPILYFVEGPYIGYGSPKLWEEE